MHTAGLDNYTRSLMKTLTLVRHAKSSWKDPALADHDRPLNKRGKRDAPRMGKRLAQASICPDLIITSTAVRARTTAETIASEIGYPTAHILMDEGLYLAGASGVLELIRGLGDANNHVMLFGHNPDITNLVNLLTDDHIENVPTCGIVHIRFHTTTWAKVGTVPAELISFDYPKRVDD
ncbi:MAG: histidine phosphatase family protein [Gemmatimonadota bacterium]|nr:MAG: histidine phosphatase family protein [Gemmatimonadota bacterium]